MVRAWPLACALLFGCAAVEDTSTDEAASTTDGAYTLEIAPSVAASVDEAFVRRELEAAVALYQRDVAPPTGAIPVVVGAADCLRTGYDMPTRTVRFCANADTPRVGTASADVIHHEMFHALLCQTKPAWCDPATMTAESTALHEGLADYFAYSLAPDDAFGEGFYRDRPIVRRYLVPYCYSLVSGGHEKGNAIGAALVRRGEGLEPVARLARGDDLTLASLFGAAPEDPCFGADPPAVERTVVGYPESTLERYRVRAGEPLTLAFGGDAAFERRYANLTVRWGSAPSRFSIAAVDPRTFSITATGTEGFDKVTALYEVDGEIVGGKSFYFQVARPSP